jgi:hypothetical protein
MAARGGTPGAVGGSPATAGDGGDPWARVPLLAGHPPPPVRPAGPPQPPPPPPPPADVGVRCAARVARLLRALRAWPALAFLPAAAAEAALVSRLGEISGRFYQIFVDGRRAALPGALASSAALYAAAAAFFALKAAFSEWLALSWRRRLAGRAHALYCGGRLAAGAAGATAAEGAPAKGAAAAPRPGPLAPPYYALQVPGRGPGAAGGGRRGRARPLCVPVL